MPIKKLTAPGQIKKGDELTAEYKGKTRPYIAEEILNPGTDKEEVILDVEDNLYFITSMAIDGSSWAKNVEIPK